MPTRYAKAATANGAERRDQTVSKSPGEPFVEPAVADAAAEMVFNAIGLLVFAHHPVDRDAIWKVIHSAPEGPTSPSVGRWFATSFFYYRICEAWGEVGRGGCTREELDELIDYWYHQFPALAPDLREKMIRHIAQADVRRSPLRRNPVTVLTQFLRRKLFKEKV